MQDAQHAMTIMLGPCKKDQLDPDAVVLVVDNALDVLRRRFISISEEAWSDPGRFMYAKSHKFTEVLASCCDGLNVQCIDKGTKNEQFSLIARAVDSVSHEEICCNRTEVHYQTKAAMVKVN